jgi:hypothetical protein
MFDAGKQLWLRSILALAGGIFIVNTSGCAMAEGSAEKIYHGFAIEVGDGLPAVKNVRYLYGDLGWREIKIAAPPGALSTLFLSMTIPEECQIYWETQEGKQYEFKVPVRSKVRSSIKGKTALFIIMHDHVEGYVSTSLPNFQEKRERFY